MYSRIVGTGGYLPPKILTNADLEKMVDTNDQWIVERTGIRQRHVVEDNQTTVDLAFEAAKQAIEAAGVKKSEIDLIIVATTTPNRVFPSTACLLQEKLDIHGCPAFDIQAVCTGFVYGLSVADKFIKTGAAKCALIVGAETLSRILNWEDRTTCVLFGDGAGAMVLKASDKPGILSTHLHADGQYKDLLSVSGGVSENSKVFQASGAYIEMTGSEVFKTAVKTLGSIVDETLDANH
ncbi:MAG TPA: ketoacyl-ACP synthase III, partial [Gammaproteobacteria bacterium]|nr:ketoacyl-ACP synthase III [Gammaproteobacteria bacterium]